MHLPDFDYVDVCPNCKCELFGPTCCMTYSTWMCMGCGAELDGRVIQPDRIPRSEVQPILGGLV